MDRGLAPAPGSRKGVWSSFVKGFGLFASKGMDQNSVFAPLATPRLLLATTLQ